MPVNLMLPTYPSPIEGVHLSVVAAGIKQLDRNDVLVIVLDQGSVAAGVFTQNRCCAAPVQVTRAHLNQPLPIRALVVNTGNANAGTGEQGYLRALTVCQALADELNCLPVQVLPFSTGVILEPLPADKIVRALPYRCEVDWVEAATAIMTTDTVPKVSSRAIDIEGHAVSITGISKGSGMIHPNMATMLSFIATDAAIAQPILKQLLRDVVDVSFNCISVDGDTSTNDSFMLISTGNSPLPLIDSVEQPGYARIKAELTEVAIELAQAIVRDGEGASKFITIQVNGGRSVAECKAVGYAIARSALVKTAFFASDPNLGRLLCAIGYAEISDLEIKKVALYLNDVLVVERGERHTEYREEQGKHIMAQDEILVRVELNRGFSKATLWTCDLSYDYVRINAEYRS